MIIIYLFSIVFSLACSIINAEILPKNQVKPSWNFKDGVKKNVVVEPLGAMVRIILHITHCWKDCSEKKNVQPTSQIQILKILH